MNARRLLLIGGGHAHVQVLLAWRRQPVPGAQLWLVSPQPLAWYSGMLPGWMAGHWPREAIGIDLPALCAATGAQWIQGEVQALEPGGPGRVGAAQLADGRTIEAELFSLDIGSTLTPPPAAPGGRLLALRPLQALLAGWEALLADPWLRDDPAPLAVTIAGGGAAAVEVLLAACARLRAEHPQRVLLPRLISRADALLPGMAPRAGLLAMQALERAGVQVQFGVDARRVVAMPARSPGLLLWATGAEPHRWPQASGVACDAQGFVQVDARLRSVSHANLLAAGDAAATLPPRPKAGVFAVRAGPVLAHNLLAELAGSPLRDFAPQQHYLALLSTADGRAIAARGDWAAAGRWAERWKRHIDQRFMARFRLPPARAGA